MRHGGGRLRRRRPFHLFGSRVRGSFVVAAARRLVAPYHRHRAAHRAPQHVARGRRVPRRRPERRGDGVVPQRVDRGGVLFHGSRGRERSELGAELGDGRESPSGVARGAGVAFGFVDVGDVGDGGDGFDRLRPERAFHLFADPRLQRLFASGRRRRGVRGIRATVGVTVRFVRRRDGLSGVARSRQPPVRVDEQLVHHRLVRHAPGGGGDGDGVVGAWLPGGGSRCDSAPERRRPRFPYRRARVHPPRGALFSPSRLRVFRRVSG
mmetsp:Transcript_12694/g.54498  ORF Transcript_12694/g.54498 Transcript_12694/m.54498 type:complete len:266 (+) Transcript_12694:270-1067(+)